MKLFQRHMPATVLAILAGILLTFAFAPYGWYWLAFFSLAILMPLWRDMSPAKAAWRGWCYGLGFFGVGVSWIFISIHQYGGSGILLATIITAVFVMFLAVFPALQGYFLQRFFPHETLSKWLLAFPALWVISEAIRSHLFTGFPWLLLGDSQTNSPLGGFIPVVGIYGTGFLTVEIAACIGVFAWRYPRRWIFLVLTCILFFSGVLLAKISWTTPLHKPISVTLVQGNIQQSIKWNPQQAINTLNLYTTLTENHWQSQLIIWPETAIPLLLPDAWPYLQPLQSMALAKGRAIITGVPIPSVQNGVEHYYNGAIVLGAGQGQYFKRHLVPFGEYVPLEKWLRGIINFLNLPMSMFSAGPMHQPLLKAAGLKIAPFICYEVAYTNLVRSDLPAANLFITMSDDAWFDRSAALAQHLQIAQFAAMVSRRYMLVVTNSGETAIVSPKGKLLAKAPIDTINTLSGNVYGMVGATPWVTYGNKPVLGVILLLLGIASYRQKW